LQIVNGDMMPQQGCIERLTVTDDEIRMALYQIPKPMPAARQAGEQPVRGDERQARGSRS
jgi:hypothetical protein